MYFSFLFILLFSSCDYQGSYSFLIENKTEKDVTIKFRNDSYCSFHNNEKEVVILSGEEKKVRVIEGALNSSSHDWLKEQKETYLIDEILFDTYIGEERINKELWQRENWSYHKNGRWEAEYKMIITNELLEEDNL